MSAVALAYTIVGPAGAPVVVLGPSLGSTTAMWDRQVPVLRQRFRVLAYDTRGHGRSPVPPGPYEIDDLVDDVVLMLDRLGLDRVHVVGLSLGGMTAMRLAARRPDRVDRLVVACTSARLGPAQQWADRAAVVRAGGVRAVAEPVVRRWFTDAGRAADPALVSWAEDMVSSNPADGYAECCGAIERMDLRADLPAIEAPLLAIAGAEDLATPPDQLRAIVDAVPGARLVLIDGAAHLANLEQPAAFTAAVLDHLEPEGRASHG